MSEEETKDVSEMFAAGDDSDVMTNMQGLAASIAISGEEYEVEDAELKKKKATIEEMKLQLNELMMANGCTQGHKFDNGINVKPSSTTKIFKAAGTSDDMQQDWLKDNGLGDIIKPTVNWNTFSSAMTAYVDGGGELPDIFNPVTKNSVKFVGNGKKLFLATRRMETN